MKRSLQILLLSLLCAAALKQPVVAFTPNVLNSEISLDIEPTPAPIAEPAVAEVVEDSSKRGKHSKWTLIKSDTLFWVISSLATLDDINNIRNDILGYEAEMNFNSLQYDPLNLFLTNIIVNIKLPTKGGQGKSEGSTYTPAKGFSGYITKQGSLGMGQLPPEPLLTAMKQDYETALKLKEEHFPEYVEDSLNKNIFKNEGSLATQTYLKQSMEGENGQKVLSNTGIGKSSWGTLLIKEKYKDIQFYLNGNPSGFAEVNSVPFEKLHKVSIKSVRNSDKYVLVFTK
ncbi:hypothetical protein [Telluribacter sp. SYSU D00476]|uniref:hypothetical protein n=1 Tax=Telluribacter sp. SYSU D00476 TaxID=2811430 RepID=UPI001FF3866B|nr:hypothetical protein [Telluribacter sp. SYSU D00476]